MAKLLAIKTVLYQGCVPDKINWEMWLDDGIYPISRIYFTIDGKYWHGIHASTSDSVAEMCWKGLTGDTIKINEL